MNNSILSDISPNLTPIQQAYLIQKKASEVGFDWESIDGVYKKIKEELNEFKEIHKENNIPEMERELGDLIMAVINLAQFCNIDPNKALLQTIKKFKIRFSEVEKGLKKQNKSFKETSLEEMEEIWQNAKKII